MVQSLKHGARFKPLPRSFETRIRLQAGLRMFAAMALLQNWLGVKRALAMADARIVARKQQVQRERVVCVCE